MTRTRSSASASSSSPLASPPSSSSPSPSPPSSSPSLHKRDHKRSAPVEPKKLPPRLYESKEPPPPPSSSSLSGPHSPSFSSSPRIPLPPLKVKSLSVDNSPIPSPSSLITPPLSDEEEARGEGEEGEGEEEEEEEEDGEELRFTMDKVVPPSSFPSLKASSSASSPATSLPSSTASASSSSPPSSSSSSIAAAPTVRHRRNLPPHFIKRPPLFPSDVANTNKLKYMYKAMNYMTDLFFAVDRDLDHLPEKRQRKQAVKEVPTGRELLDQRSNCSIPSTVSPGYGELSREGFDKILFYLQHLAPPPLRLSSSSSFLDIGSGFGKCVVHAKVRSSCLSSVGIEYIHTRHRLAEECLFYLAARHIPGISAINEQPLDGNPLTDIDVRGVRLMQGDVCNPSLWPIIEEQTHIYAFDVVFNAETHSRLLPLVARAPRLKLFICYTQPKKIEAFGVKCFDCIHRIKSRTTGGQWFTCYFYQRREGAELPTVPPFEEENESEEEEEQEEEEEAEEGEEEEEEEKEEKRGKKEGNKGEKKAISYDEAFLERRRRRDRERYWRKRNEELARREKKRERTGQEDSEERPSSSSTPAAKKHRPSSSSSSPASAPPSHSHSRPSSSHHAIYPPCPSVLSPEDLSLLTQKDVFDAEYAAIRQMGIIDRSKGSELSGEEREKKYGDLVRENKWKVIKEKKKALARQQKVKELTDGVKTENNTSHAGNAKGEKGKKEKS